MKLRFLESVVLGLFVATIFSARWSNSLPFSGRMPITTDIDSIAFWGKYLVYAQEPFTWPLGTIHNLSFPFQDANIASGSIPLLAVPLKLLARIYSPVGQFYYFVAAEIVSIALVGLVSNALLKRFGVTSFWTRFLGVSLISLSPLILYRSSNYYGVTFTVLNFPLYLLTAYVYIRLLERPDHKRAFLYLLMFPISALVDSYLWFGIVFMGLMGLVLTYFQWRSTKMLWARSRLRMSGLSFVSGLVISWLVLTSLGNHGTLEPPSRRQALTGRFTTDWGYGGGFGGGFHVADALAPFISSTARGTVPVWKQAGLGSYLENISYPLTTAIVADGQYEGFAYIGSVTLTLLAIVLIKFFPWKKLKWRSLFYHQNTSIPAILILSSFSLFTISWGYIIHFLGIRFNWLPTPALLLAFLWPKFMYARSLGRLAAPFTLALLLITIVLFDRILKQHFNRRFKTLFLPLLITGLVLIHILEIRGYLDTSQATASVDIVNSLSDDESTKLKKIAAGKRAIILAEPLRTTPQWTKIAYALAYHAGIPISGATVGLGDSPEHNAIYQRDIKDLQAGKISLVQERYGSILVAASGIIGQSILAVSDTPIDVLYFSNDQLVILVPR
ncbi:hypothetical protein A2783_02855 [Microgenomates group bacterium RIFCSPHIGHO2_01_FULL_45_11]|nr:MAG: hypothetical protein A2783_02855 [Microgenomates group bacterium RIFCSPHIGHO2_01_FULL_45_11]